MSGRGVDYDKLRELRRSIHEQPRLASCEGDTCDTVLSFLSLSHADPPAGVHVVKNMGKSGLAIIFDGVEAGPCVCLRADLDALPISEEHMRDRLPYTSKVPGVSHKCGHDGHTTILCGVAQSLLESPPRRGKVVLLFQPAEERGYGARQVIQDPRWKSHINPSFMFGLHNLPTFEKHAIVSRNGIFASASTGLTAEFSGQSSHASHPEEGRSPAIAVAATVMQLLSIPPCFTEFGNAALITVVHSSVGVKDAFGTSPGGGIVQCTLRSHSNGDMHKLREQSEKVISTTSSCYNLTSSVSYTDEFDALQNDSNCVDMIVAASKQCGLKSINQPIPMPWSEDFAQYTSLCPCGFFCVGMGNSAPLHAPDYDFDDDLIMTGVRMFLALLAAF